jgi:dual specificity phosphatase 12
MDGIQLKAVQVAKGLHVLVDNIDELRLMLGFSHVDVVTPKAETRLRSGDFPAIPLVVNGTINGLVLEITFPVMFPWEEPMSVKVLSYNALGNDEECKEYDLDDPIVEELQNKLNELCHTRVDDGDQYIGSKGLVEFIKGYLNPDNTQNYDIVDEGTENNESTHYYSCMMCRYVLFHDYELMPHESTDSDAERFNGIKEKCTSYFLQQPPTWLLDTTAPSGKLSCVKCNAKLGQWIWSGTSCSCGKWVVPSFQFNCSKVDVKETN